MSHEECAEINNVKNQDEYTCGDSEKMERSNNDDTEGTSKKLGMNENGGTEAEKGESVERNEEDEEKELAREDVCRLVSL